MTNSQIRILCVDDHPLFREGICTMISKQADMTLLAEASTSQEAIELFREQKPDVTLMDLRLPDRNGIDTITAIRTESPGACIVMLSTFEGDVQIQRALKAGAHAYALKSMPPQELTDVIRKAHAGKKIMPSETAVRLAEYYPDDSLTQREIEVLRKLTEGNSNREIAQQLFVSEETVKVHVRHIMEKLNASDRTQAVVIGIRRGIICV